MSTNSTCCDCSQPQASVPLQCKLHFICLACLTQRGRDQPENVTTCGECVEKKASTGVLIFIDDSNIWIEAKKLQSEKKRFKTAEDHRVRIDVGKLTDAIADGRPVRQGNLYGSEPPPVDTVWKKIRELKNFSVRTKHRSHLTGKEKQVDTMIVADITEVAITTPIHDRTTIIIVTGDADAVPGLEKVLKQERWKIEIYMWKKAIANTLYRFASDHKDRVKIKELDGYLDKVTFTSMRIKISIPEDKFLLQKVMESGVVCTMISQAFENRVPTKAWCRQLEHITQWPFQYYWFEHSGETKDHLVIAFQQNKQEKPDITKFLDVIQTSIKGDKCCLPKVQQVQTFQAFSQNIFKKEELSKCSLEQVVNYDKDHDKDDIDLEPVVNYDKDDVDNYEIVAPKKMKKYRLYSDPCRYKMNCSHGKKCQNKHSEEEKEYFRKQIDGRGNPMRKTALCNHYSEGGRCRKDARNCNFAHGENDAWCVDCISTGHLTINCPNNEK